MGRCPDCRNSIKFTLLALVTNVTFNLSCIACSIKDCTDDNVGSFAYELSVFDEFKGAYMAFNFSKPTKIIASFGLEGDVSGYLFSESNLDLPVTVNSFGINILVTVSDGPTSN